MKVTWIFQFELQIELKKVWWKPIIYFTRHEKNGVLFTEFMFCLLACKLSSLPSAVSPATPIAVFPVRHLPLCFSSLLLETQCLASKRVLDRIHQPDQYPLENASSALLAIIFIQPWMAFGVDHRTCFPNMLQTPIRLEFCRYRTPNTGPLMHPQSYLSCSSSWGGPVSFLNVYSELVVICYCWMYVSFIRKLQINQIESVMRILWCSGQAAGNSRVTLWATILDKKNASFIPRITTSGPAAQLG